MLTSGFDPELVPMDVHVDDQAVRVIFNGGLEVATPVARFPRLQNATPEQRANWRLIGRGDGLHWPELDEDISVRGLFRIPDQPPHAMAQVPPLIGDLYRTTQRLNDLFPGRPFTPDGHLVGSIGEVAAEYIYGLDLTPCSTPGVDAHTEDKRTVQIKLTGQNGTSYGIRWSNAVSTLAPDLLICLKLEKDGFHEIYNGPFPLDMLRGKKDQKNNQIALAVGSLRRQNPSLLPQKHSFEEVNRWFPTLTPDAA